MAQEPSYLVVHGARDSEKRVPIEGHLAVGRHCVGVAERHRLLVDDPSVSSYHLDIRLNVEQDRAEVVDLSTNGTRLNGVRIQRGVPTPLRSGDRLEVGGLKLELRSARFQTTWTRDRTAPSISTTQVVMAVGDVIGFSTLSEKMDSEPLTNGMSRLFGELHRELRLYDGTLASNAGDALLAVWEVSAFPDAADSAVAYALSASERVSSIAAELPFKMPSGEPLKMGWAIVGGGVGIASMAGALMTVLGDAANLAFRLSGLAGRGGRPAVLVTEQIRSQTSKPYTFHGSERLTVKGRSGIETVFGVEGVGVAGPERG